jgi:hypothetical protein
MHYCHQWPNETVAHWDSSYLHHYYGTSSVDYVVFYFPYAFPTTGRGLIEGDNARVVTAFYATSAYAELFLANGKTVFTNAVFCDPKP